MADPTLVPLAPGGEKWHLVTSSLNGAHQPIVNGNHQPVTSSPTATAKYPLSSFSQVVAPPKRTAYRLSSQLLEEDVPLLMRFMHKPLRAQLELKRALDPTRRNSLINAQRLDSSEPVNPSSRGGASASEPHVLVGDSLSELHLDGQNTDIDDVDEEEDDEPHSNQRYRLVRKKSGEIVKPLLKDTIAAINRLRSLPLTPTYKQVHFGGDNDVRYFKQKDKPAAILAQNSPTLAADEGYFAGFASSDEDSEASDNGYLGRLALYGSEYQLFDDYLDDELNSHIDATSSSKRSSRKYRDHSDKTHYPRIEWQMELLEFPQLLYQEKIMLRHMPVFLEQTFLSIDKKYLLGQIAVRNLLYEKNVTIRYTLDHWGTIVEIPTIYVPDPPAVLRTNNYDRFVFKILLDLLFEGLTLSDEVSPGRRERTYELCVRYASPDFEYWDNNDNKNYVIKILRFEKPVDTPAPKTKVPSAARSKQQAHIKKPKYSSSYLKRIVSEPSLSKSAETSHASPKPAEYNDFELNNYYLSSPLLLSLNNKDLDEHPFKNYTRLARDVVEKPTPSPAVRSATNLESVDPFSSSDDLSPNEDEPRTHDVPKIPVSPKPTRHKRIDSMSYKELLDSYCFFSAPAGENLSSTTLVLSDEPNMLYENGHSDSQPNRSIEPDNAFTVSSFLRN